MASRVPLTQSEPAATTESAQDLEPQPIVLHVLDRDTDRPLAGAIVARGPSGWCIPQEGAWEVDVIAEGTSPLAIPANVVCDAEATTLLVRAAGFAWRELHVQGSSPRTIRLARAGELEVVVDGECIEGAFVCVRRAIDSRQRPAGMSEERWDELTRCGGELVRAAEWKDNLPLSFASLAAGDYVVRVEYGFAVLAASPVVIMDGALQRVKLSPRRSLLLHMVRTSVTVQLAPGWHRPIEMLFDLPDHAYIIEHRVTQQPCPGGGSFQFELDLPVGRHEVHFLGFGYHTSCDVGPTGQPPLQFEVPAPARLLVDVVDSETGERLQPYIHVGANGYTRFRSGEVVVLPPGRHEVFTSDDDYLTARAEVEVTPAGGELVLRTARVCGVKVTLREGDVDLPQNPGWALSLRNADGSNGAISWCSDNTITALPGTYTLLVEDVDGYEPIQPRTVVVEAAKWTAVTIPIEPARR
ncbi:MAG TPA: hypothetical protein VFT55_12450 [Planctomycetota bacterium]|nr:hypothetical protein [Planctomycetota bacterium]